MNATFALRGHPADYDGWALPGWAFDDVLPAFVRLERDLDFGAAPHHGDAGPVPIRRYLGEERSELTAAVEEAFVAAGIPRDRRPQRPGRGRGVGPAGQLRRRPADQHGARLPRTGPATGRT